MENITSQQLEDLKNFYTTFDLTKVKNIKNLQDQVLFQLYKNDKKTDIQPTFDVYKKNFTHQADLLYLPSDAGFKYGLTVVDLGSRLTDCEPLKTRTSKAVAEALAKIYTRPVKTRILNIPQRIEVDSGAEFKGAFKTYCETKKIFIRTAEPFRSRQQAFAEARNGAISKPLLRRMLAAELLTNKPDLKWVQYLPTVLNFLNKRFKRTDRQILKLQKDNDVLLPVDKFNAELLEVGQKVRYLLDKPIDHTTKKRLHGTFRQGDVRWSKPETIEELKLIPAQLPLYKITNRTNWFTKDQLQPISGQKLPPDTVKIAPANKKK